MSRLFASPAPHRSAAIRNAFRTLGSYVARDAFRVGGRLLPGYVNAVRVDLRFTRARHDAASTLGAFAARLREPIDLGALEHELLGGDKTPQPARASVLPREAGQ